MSYEHSVEKYLRETCEAGMAVHQKQGLGYACPTCEPYITFCTNPKPEGEVGTYFPSVGEARDAFVASFQAYKAEHAGVLFWRHYPEVITLEPGFFGIYARLVISQIKEGQ